MDKTEIAEQRAAVVSEAKTWIGTPYHHQGQVKGHGVDCATLLVRVFIDTGCVPEFTLEFYPKDWHLHRNVEKYLGYLLDRANEMAPPSVRTPLPGDILLWKFGRVFSHGAIVTDYPNAIHSFSLSKCEPVNVRQSTHLVQIGENGLDHGKPRPIKVFTLKSWC